MRLLAIAALLAALSWGSRAASSSDGEPEPPPKPCTIRSSTTGSFFDLNKINKTPPDSSKKGSKEDKTSWHARGYDYGANFTLNFCGPVLENNQDYVDVDRGQWKNVAAYYERDGKRYSLGSNNSALVFRGRKLVLNYTDGSLCPSSSSERSTFLDSDIDQLSTSDKGLVPRQSSNRRRKSAVISFLCERDPTAALAAVSFVASIDDCAYFFEARSFAACPSVNVQKQSIGPGGVFGIIASIAILVYLIGGIVYQRTVMHQRGWRQLPNYALWSGMMGFIKDMFIILTSSCTRLLPGRKRGYNQLSTSANGYAGRDRGRQLNNEEENQLIDELDEEY